MFKHTYEALLLASGGVLILDLILGKMGAPEPIGWLLLGVGATLMALSIGNFLYEECK